MSLAKKINVVLYAENNEFSIHTTAFKNEGLNVVGITSDLSKVKAYLVLYKGAVIITNETTLSDEIGEVVKYIVEHNSGIIICAKKYVSFRLIGDFKHAEILYSNQFTNTDIYIYELSKKAKELSEKMQNSSNSTITARKTIDTPRPLNRDVTSTINRATTTTTTSTLTREVNSTRSLSSEATKAEKLDAIRKSGMENKLLGSFLSPYKALYEKHYSRRDFNKIIAIGASTGGPDTILHVLKALPENLAVPILIVQHMPENFTKMFAARMDRECKITVVEGVDGDPVLGGCAYVAPGGKQMEIQKTNGNYYIKVLPHDSNYVNNPSVDVMYDSVAKEFRNKIVAVILTGMGKDGSKGILKIRRLGGYTIGQDEKSSIVYGMPKVAYDIGAVKVQLPLDDIPGQVMAALKEI